MALMEKLLEGTTGAVLDPFLGSGTTAVACVRAGRPFVGIEREAEYMEIARARVTHAVRERDNSMAGFFGE